MRPDADAFGRLRRVGSAWIVLVGYLRLSTRAGIFPRPLDAPTAVGVARTWLSAPTASVAEPGPRHLEILERLIAGSGTAGNLANDAHLAAIAIELRATVVTYDRDFGRFGVPLHLPA